MNVQVLFGLIVFVAAAFGKPSGGCEGPVFKFNGVNYKRELLETVSNPESLSYDRSTNNLFMIHDHPRIYSEVGAKLKLGTNELETIDGVTNVETVSVDAKTNKVYIEATGGIFKYDKNSNKGELYVASNTDIARHTKLLFVKDDTVYFAAIPPWTVYKIVNGEVSKFKDLETTRVRKLVIDDNDNKFFSNTSGLYRQNAGSQEVVYYTNSEKLEIEGITISNEGVIYAFAGSSGIYTVSKNTNDIEKVSDVTAYGLTFDGDNNVIYADRKHLYKLKPNNDSNCA